MNSTISDRDIVLRHIVVMTLPKILQRDVKRIEELGLLSAITHYIESLQIKIESEQRDTRALLRSRNIKIIELHTKDGIRCRYTVRGYEELIDLLPSVIKSACDRYLHTLMGLPLSDNI